MTDLEDLSNIKKQKNTDVNSNKIEMKNDDNHTYQETSKYQKDKESIDEKDKINITGFLKDCLKLDCKSNIVR